MRQFASESHDFRVFFSRENTDCQGFSSRGSVDRLVEPLFDGEEGGVLKPRWRGVHRPLSLFNPKSDLLYWHKLERR